VAKPRKKRKKEKLRQLVDSAILGSGILDSAYDQAKEVIRICSTPNGLYASGGIEGYNALWARDSMISFLGASLVQDNIKGKNLTTKTTKTKKFQTKNRENKYTPLFKSTFKKSLELLGKNQSSHGQIPNAVDQHSSRKPHVDYASIDSTLWYIIGHHIYKQRYRDNSLFKLHHSKIKRALAWLQSQDVGEDGTLLQLPTTDWQDAFPHKYGRTINTQALYYHVLKLLGQTNSARRLQRVINTHPDKKLWNGHFYYAYRWKNHNKYKEIGEWFDTLGNLLAIVFDLADKSKSKTIISYLEKNKVHRPFPVKAIFPPLKKSSKDWQDYFRDCEASEPNHYLNGGIWTFIGGFYILALIKLNKFSQALTELKLLAQANLKGNFPEWIDPLTRKPHGKLQAWNAGMYLLAYESLMKKKVLI